MIDYEKLKIAHAMARQWSLENSRWMDLALCTSNTETMFILKSGEERFYSGYSLDDLVSKLTELTKLLPKYKIGETVWRVFGEEHPTQMKIYDIRQDENGLYEYSSSSEDFGCWYLEHQIYPSKEALIDAQIEYWKNLECEDNSSGSRSCTHIKDPDWHDRCIKCGEFY